MSAEYFPGPATSMRTQKMRYKIAISGKSPSRTWRRVAINMVNPSKDDETLVRRPATINKATIDSDKEAMRPKKVLRNSKPIKLVSAPPRPYHRSTPPNSLP